jgi:hypothetical protein
MDNELITTFKKYKESYPIRLEKHKVKYEDYDELHFINSELYFYENCYKTANVSEYRFPIYNQEFTDYKNRFLNSIEAFQIFEPSEINEGENYDVRSLIKEGSFLTDYYNLEVCNQLTTSFTKIIEYLNIEKNKFKNDSEFPKVKFHGTQTEFIELLKALTENNNLRGTQKDNIEICSNFFDIKINNPTKLVSDINNSRNNGSETLFIDKLKRSLLNYIQQQNQKK